MALCEILCVAFVGYNFVKVEIPTFLHCVETAAILATTKASFEVVATGVVHDADDDFNLSH
jgi:(p)ppGpp synthase/HD superfamily hydrolase